MKHFAEKGFQIIKSYQGIYHIHTGSLFPTQIVVTKDLDRTGHIWLKSLSGKLQKEDVRQLLERMKGLTEEFDKEMADSILKVSVDANKQLIEKMMEDESMYESLMELMEPKLILRDKRKMEEGLKQGLQQGEFQTLYNLVCDNLMTIESAAKRKNMSTNEFYAKLAELNII